MTSSPCLNPCASGNVNLLVDVFKIPPTVVLSNETSLGASFIFASAEALPFPPSIFTAGVIL